MSNGSNKKQGANGIYEINSKPFTDPNQNTDGGKLFIYHQ
jgi:hypothetical protein